jgi:tRNA/tmRNA/rRNA uracil-C5-methylase (TrmA/RlmC/RlmD family)
MEYSFSSIEYDLNQNIVVDEAFALGFKRKGTWWMVENLDKDSGLFDKEFEDLLNQIRLFLKNTGLPAWHPPKKIGFFRHLVVRKSYQSNELLFNLVTSSKDIKKFNVNEFGIYLSNKLKERFAGLIHTVNDDVGDREKLDKGFSKLIKGKSIIEEKINGFDFEISMQSFFQTNPKCAELLYSKVVDYLNEDTIPNDQYIMDLFCGTGTIAQLIAKNNNNKVIGVDIVKSAIENAKKQLQKK